MRVVGSRDEGGRGALRWWRDDGGNLLWCEFAGTVHGWSDVDWCVGDWSTGAEMGRDVCEGEARELDFLESTAEEERDVQRSKREALTSDSSSGLRLPACAREGEARSASATKEGRCI